MSLSLPANLDLNLARQNYLIHQEFCQGLLTKLPDEMRMERKNAGFHHCASAIGALGATVTHLSPSCLKLGYGKQSPLHFFSNLQEHLPKLLELIFSNSKIKK